MGKVTKILLKTLSVALLFLIFCPIVLTLVVELPSVQDFLIGKASSFVSSKLGTKVDVRHLHIGVLGGVTANGVYVEDFDKDTLLYVERLHVDLVRINEDATLALRKGYVRGGKLYIHEASNGEMNIKQVVDSFVNRDKERKGGFSLSLKNISLSDFDLIIERREHCEPEYGIDYYDMHIENISGVLDDFILQGSEIDGHVSDFSFVEHTGFEVKNFAGDFSVKRGQLNFHDVDIISTQSSIHLTKLTLSGRDWSEYKDFIHKVRIEGEVAASIVSTDDIAHFAPRLLPWQLTATDVRASVSGYVSDLKVNLGQLKFGESSSLQGKVRLQGLPDVKRGRMTLDLRHLRSNAADAIPLLTAITGLTVRGKALDVAKAAGRIVLAGEFDGGMSRFDSDVTLTTDAGVASLRASRAPLRVEKGENPISALHAHADLRHLKLGHLLASEMLGDATLSADFDGRLSHGHVWGDLTARVSDMEFNDCRYQDVEVRGVVDNKSFTGHITDKNSPLDIDIAGTANFNYHEPLFDFTVDLKDADLHAMNINKRDSVSRLSLRANVYAMGRDIDNLNGRVIVNRGRYIYNADTLSSSIVELTAQSDKSRRSLELVSDFADATFTGPTSYADLAKYLQEAMRKYLPGLADEDERYAGSDLGYSALSLRVKNIDPLLDAVAEGLELARGTKLDFTMNPATNHLMLRAESDYIERKKWLITNLNVNLTNRSDSLAVYLSSEDLYLGALHLPQLSLMGGAKNDRVLITAGLHSEANSDADSLSGVIGLMAQVEQDSVTQHKCLAVDILPSKLSANSQVWHIAPSHITIDTTRVAVQGFCISSGEERLDLEGVASRREQDSLTLRMKDFSLSPLTNFVERMGYTIDGRGNGEATMRAVLAKGVFTADIAVDGLKVNQHSVAPLKLSSRWDFRQQRARIYMINRMTQDSVVRGYFSPASGRYYAEAELDSLPLAALDPLLTSVVSQTEGLAFARLNIAGKGREAKLNGEIDVENLSTMVDYTRARYSVPKARVEVRDNHFLANDIRMMDTEGHSGMFAMDLSLEHLKNIAYDFRITPREMIVLNTTSQDNDLFYGKVYASGVATIRGSKNGTTLDIVGTTEGNSQFYMPLSSKSDVSNADFVIFERPDMQVDTANYLLRKKMLFERRNRRTTASNSNMAINIALTARPNVEVQLVIDPTVGDIIKARGEGTLNMRVVPRDNIFDMYGDYTITEGSYLFTLQNIINKLFLIESGSTIQWTGEPMDPRLNINAVYKLKASLQPLLSSTTLDNITRNVPVECIINLTEQLSNPTVTFDIKVPNADSEIQNAVANLLNNQQSIATQFMYLLVSGSFYSDSSTSSNFGATASATTGFELLSNQLSNWLSSDDYNIILRYRPRSELTSDEIDIGFSKTLVENRLLLEVEGNYLVDNKMSANSNMSNFMGEAYLTWLIDRAGNLKLKGFTQTIDRFDENQGLQETGVGIYYKEDFDNWADLKRRIRDRFMSRKRRAALEAMAAGEQADSVAMKDVKSRRKRK